MLNLKKCLREIGIGGFYLPHLEYNSSRKDFFEDLYEMKLSNLDLLIVDYNYENKLTDEIFLPLAF